MSMLAMERDRPVREPEDPKRAAFVRRALSRWALRLAVREWKQRILIVCLITVATTATLLGIAVASATPGTPDAGIYGTASTLVQLPGTTPDLPGVIAKIAVFIATLAIVIASVRFDDALDYVAPNMASNQLILYAPGNDPAQYQPGQFTPAAKLAGARNEADTLAAQLHAPAPLELDLAVSPNVTAQGQPTQNQPGGLVSLHGRGIDGRMYVATPALLTAFGITASEVNPAADVLTMRAGLPSAGDLALVSGSYIAQSPPGCPAGLCLLNPVIQEVSKLPAGTSVPNLVITEQAVRALHETVVPVGWLVQSPAALTPVQVNAARQAAVGLGTTIETKSGQLSLGQISGGATIGGILLALGVLAMTVGLIRSETSGDLRTLTATGAGARTRRALTGVTTGAIALLGAALGTVTAFLASLSWAHANLTGTFSNVPWSDVGLLVIGMPLAGAAAGWLLGGRAPSGVARQSLE